MNADSVSLPDFQPYVGRHCETVATGSLLGAAYLGIGKLADALPGWLRIAKDPANDLALSSIAHGEGGHGVEGMRALVKL